MENSEIIFTEIFIPLSNGEIIFTRGDVSFVVVAAAAAVVVVVNAPVVAEFFSEITLRV